MTILLLISHSRNLLITLFGSKWPKETTIPKSYAFISGVIGQECITRFSCLEKLQIGFNFPFIVVTTSNFLISVPCLL